MESKKHGSRPKHLWDIHTDVCKKCGMPRWGPLEFPVQLYGCSVSRKEWGGVNSPQGTVGKSVLL
jgi:hypothetical protein